MAKSSLLDLESEKKSPLQSPHIANTAEYLDTPDKLAKAKAQSAAHVSAQITSKTHAHSQTTKYATSAKNALSH
jgi:hypothetical protein